MKLPYPLWEAFPSLTPYHFAYNNPISFHDNSGLAPEKEKGDRILANDPTKGHLLMISFNNANATDFVIDIMQQCDDGYSFDWDEYNAKQQAKLEGLACNFAIEERYPRLGTAESANGISLTHKQINLEGMTKEEINKLENIINSSNELAQQWNEIIDELNADPNIKIIFKSVLSSKIDGAAGFVQKKGNLINISLSTEFLKNDFSKTDKSIEGVRIISHEGAHTLGHLNGESIPINSKNIINMNGSTIQAEELRGTQISNSITKPFIESVYNIPLNKLNFVKKKYFGINHLKIVK